jgi:hypothetical protein
MDQEQKYIQEECFRVIGAAEKLIAGLEESRKAYEEKYINITEVKKRMVVEIEKMNPSELEKLPPTRENIYKGLKFSVSMMELKMFDQVSLMIRDQVAAVDLCKKMITQSTDSTKRLLDGVEEVLRA